MEKYRQARFINLRIDESILRLMAKRVFRPAKDSRLLRSFRRLVRKGDAPPRKFRHDLRSFSPTRRKGDASRRKFSQNRRSFRALVRKDDASRRKFSQDRRSFRTPGEQVTHSRERSARTGDLFAHPAPRQLCGAAYFLRSSTASLASLIQLGRIFPGRYHSSVVSLNQATFVFTGFRPRTA